MKKYNVQSGEGKWGPLGEKASQNGAKSIRKRVPFHQDGLLVNKKSLLFSLF
jgi:hypothetical protein